MNLISFEHSEKLSGPLQVKLQGRAFVHARTVLKAEVGKNLRLGQLNGPLGWGEVQEIGESEMLLQFIPEKAAPPPLPVTLLLALPRPKSLPRILQAISSMGVKQIHFLNTWKVEKCFWSSDYLATENVRQACVLGLEQSVDTVLPEVHFHKLFRPFVEDVLPEMVQQKNCFVAHPYAKAKLEVQAEEESSILAIGPEGGFIDYEIEKLQEQGFQEVSLGQRVLKLETAIPAMLSRFIT